MIGDSTWDCKAAKTARVRSIGVLTGGFSEAELLDAGASKVFSSVEDLRSHLGDTVLRAESGVDASAGAPRSTGGSGARRASARRRAGGRSRPG